LFQPRTIDLRNFVLLVTAKRTV